MYFEPVSAIEYLRLDDERQVLVCALSSRKEASWLQKKWAGRAVAVFEFHAGDDVMDVVRDLLANPQIRALVFEGEGKVRSIFSGFWSGALKIGLQGVAEQHVTVMRQFVDLYDGDCGIRGPLQPFWPERLRYATRDRTGEDAVQGPRR